MPKKSDKEYLKIKGAYARYLAFYKFLNKGSLHGSTPFDVFYIYKSYIIRYMEPHRITAHSYK